MKQRKLTYNILTTCATALFVVLFSSCQKEELVSIPLVKIGDFNNPTAHSTNVDGDIYDAGEGIDEYGHCYSTNGTPTINDSKTTLGGTSSKKPFTSKIEGLTPSTSYTFRAYAISKGMEFYSDSKKFTTLSGKASVITTPVDTSTITTNSAIGGGNVSSANGDMLISKGLCWNTTSLVNLTNKIGSTANGNEIGTYADSLTNLNPGVKYYLRAYAITNIDTAYGETVSFITRFTEPVAITDSASAVSFDSAKLNGLVNGNGTSTNNTFEYRILNTSDWTSIEATTTNTDDMGFQQVSASPQDLDDGITYEYRVKAVSSGGITFGDILTFTTGYDKPFAETSDTSEVTKTSAKLHGLVNARGTNTVVSFDYKKTEAMSWLSVVATPSDFQDYEDRMVEATLTDLEPGNKYVYRVKAESTAGVSYGLELTLTTGYNPPMAMPNIPDPASITYTSVKLSGTVNPNGSETTVIFEYRENGSTEYRIINASQNTLYGSIYQEVDATVNDLEEGKLYFFRITAESIYGGKYTSEEIQFKAGEPTVTTLSPTNITNHGATLRGSYEEDGTVLITERGFSYWKKSDPSQKGDPIYLGSGSYSFFEILTTLELNTVYEVSAWIQNSNGKFYYGDTIDLATTINKPLFDPILVFSEPFSNNIREWQEYDDIYIDGVDTFYFGASVENNSYKIYNQRPLHTNILSMKDMGTFVSNNNFEINANLTFNQYYGNNPEAGIVWYDDVSYYNVSIGKNHVSYIRRRISDDALIESNSTNSVLINGAGDNNFIKIAGVNNQFQLFVNNNYIASYSRDNFNLKEIKCAVKESDVSVNYITINQENN